METVTFVGYIAAFFTTVSFLPQVIKTLKTKQTKDISLLMYVFFCTGISLWLAYGFMLAEYPIILANLFTLLLAMTVLGIKLKYG